MTTVTGSMAQNTRGNILVMTWQGLADGDDGKPANMANFPDRTAQAIGDATSVAIQGSNDGTNWFALTDPSGSAIGLAGATNDVALIVENTLLIRPVVSGGSDTDIIITGVSER